MHTNAKYNLKSDDSLCDAVLLPSGSLGTKARLSVLLASLDLFLLIIAFEVLFLNQAHEAQADLEIMTLLLPLPVTRMRGFNIMPSLCRHNECLLLALLNETHLS